MLDCAFYTLALRRMEAEVDPRNVASGILLARWVTKGEARDVESFGLLQPERWS